MPNCVQVPPHVAPTSADPVQHLLFALKHEDLNLQGAILALKKIDGFAVGRAFLEAPSSVYARQLGYLWELANEKTLGDLPAAQGGYLSLFDEMQYVTGPAVRHPRWRVNFNGIGSPWFSPTVRRTKELQALLDLNIIGQARDFVSGLDTDLLDRAVRWAYLSETRGSYQIEKEMPTESKAQAFAALLSRVHEPKPITEGYLVELQNITVDNGLGFAFEFRNRQNWLRGALPGALAVTYVPPPPQMVPRLMDEIMALANSVKTSGIDPLVHASLASFSFVLAHPFMDGNGRLSRFLFHHVLGGSGKLPDGLVLPVSVAMQRREGEYLEALKSFSGPARDAWKVLWVDGDNFELEFQSCPELYRYWDATACVEFGLSMAQEALDRDLRAEGEYLARYDRVYKAVNGGINMNGNDLALLVQLAIQNGGVLPKSRIRQYAGKGHPLPILNRAKEIIAGVYRAEARFDVEPEIERRVAALPELRATAGPAFTFGAWAEDAIDDAGGAHAVDWDGVHRDAATESIQRNHQEPEGVEAALLLHSPGAVTTLDQEALKRLIAQVASAAVVPGPAAGRDLGI